MMTMKLGEVIPKYREYRKELVDQSRSLAKQRDEAKKKRDQYKRKRELGMSELADTITLEQWIDIWYSKYKPNIKPSSAKNYRAHTTRLKNKLGPQRLMRSIVEADLQTALYEIADTSASNIEKYHSFITQVFSKAVRNRILLYDPSEDLIVPEGYEGTHRALERWETDFIFANWQKHRVGLWAMIMLLCGLRRGEMMALDWSDIDLENRQLYVHQTAVLIGNKATINDKTKTIAGMRVLPICEPLYRALCTVPEEDRAGKVCLSAHGQPLTSSGIKRGWDGFNLAMSRLLNNEPLNQQGRRTDLIVETDKEESKLKFSIKMHDLRHTFATALYDAGVSVKAAQYYLGHADMRMTLELYTHLSTEREKRERSELTTFLDGWIKPVDADPQNGNLASENLPILASRKP